MAEQFKNIWKSITEFWGKLSSRTKKLAIGGMAAIVVVAVILTIILNKKEYVALFSGMDEKETAEVMKQH